MNPIIILAGLAVLYLVVSRQQSTAATGVSGGFFTPTANPPVTAQVGMPIVSVPSPGGGISGVGIAGAATNTGLGIASTFAQAGSAVASAIPIIGAAVAPIFSLLAAHSARVKGAKTENDALNQIIPAVQTDIKSVFQAANANQISRSQAMTALNQILDNYWSCVAPFEHGPGQAGGPNMCKTYNPPQGYPPLKGTIPPQYAGYKRINYSACDTTCTASCCVGCSNVMDWISHCIAVFQSPRGGTAYLVSIIGSHYGFTGTDWWSQTFTPNPGQ